MDLFVTLLGLVIISTSCESKVTSPGKGGATPAVTNDGSIEDPSVDEEGDGLGQNRNENGQDPNDKNSGGSIENGAKSKKEGVIAKSPTPFTTEGEDHELVAWDALAGGKNDGMAAWGRLESCSREGEAENCDGIARLSIVNDPDLGDVYQAAMTASDDYRGKARAEFGNPLLDSGKDFYIYHGDDYYIGFRSKFSQGFNSLGGDQANAGNVMQLKGKLSCGGPALGLTIKNGYLTLRREQNDDESVDSEMLGNAEGVFWQGPKMAEIEGKWFELVFHINFNTDPKIGFVEVWFDGVQQKNVKGTATKIHGKTMCHDSADERVELKFGIYRDQENNKAGEFDYHWIHDPRVGKSFEAVTPR